MAPAAAAHSDLAGPGRPTLADLTGDAPAPVGGRPDPPPAARGPLEKEPRRPALPGPDRPVADLTREVWPNRLRGTFVDQKARKQRPSDTQVTATPDFATTNKENLILWPQTMRRPTTHTHTGTDGDRGRCAQ